MRMTPSLPHMGRQPKGSIPLTPYFLSFPFSNGFFTNLLWLYPNMGEATAAGVEAL